MRASYVLTETAEQDVLEIGRYIAADHPELAARVIDDIEAAMRRLGDHPMLGHRRRISRQTLHIGSGRSVPISSSIAPNLPQSLSLA